MWGDSQTDAGIAHSDLRALALLIVTAPSPNGYVPRLATAMLAGPSISASDGTYSLHRPASVPHPSPIRRESVQFPHPFVHLLTWNSLRCIRRWGGDRTALDRCGSGVASSAEGRWYHPSRGFIQGRDLTDVSAI
jgi:hypothetical protein